jgi:uncharacterized protein (UPF0332 family)
LEQRQTRWDRRMTEGRPLIAKAQRYLDSACLLIDAGDYDSAVSRIYYAAFYTAETLLDAVGLAFSSHRGVISAFGKEFARNPRLDPRYHRLLITAFEKRQHADYLAETGLERDEVEELLGDTRSFVREADVWLSRV